MLRDGQGETTALCSGLSRLVIMREIYRCPPALSTAVGCCRIVVVICGGAITSRQSDQAARCCYVLTDGILIGSGSLARVRALQGVQDDNRRVRHFIQVRVKRVHGIAIIRYLEKSAKIARITTDTTLQQPITTHILRDMETTTTHTKGETMTTWMTSLKNLDKVKDPLASAETMAAHWTALGRAASERGDDDLAERHFDRAQPWLDAVNRLLNQA